MGYARKRLILAVVGLIAFALLAFLYARFAWSWMRANAQRGLEADACIPQNTPQAKTNPNKMLFLSCGGFLQ